MGDIRSIFLVADKDQAIGKISFGFRIQSGCSTHEILVFNPKAIHIKKSLERIRNLLTVILVKSCQDPSVFHDDDHTDPCGIGS